METLSGFNCNVVLETFNIEGKVVEFRILISPKVFFSSDYEVAI
jgi:hypothetical protein